jgi:L-rhamnose 1-dehydrogenase
MMSGACNHLLAGKVLVVTGGSSGIGRAIALTAARHGAKVVIVGDLTEDAKEGGETTAALVSSAGSTGIYVPADASRADDVEALMRAADAHGGVDVMVCNAGISLSSDGPDLSTEDFERMIAVNLKGVLLGAQAAAGRMKGRGCGGSIVLISSMGGVRGNAMTVGYSATKGGINLMAASLAAAYGPDGIRVNAVCPGLIETTLSQSHPELAATFDAFVQRMPLRRFGRPDEVGDAVAWLGSDLSSFVTAIALPVDGGQLGVI